MLAAITALTACSFLQVVALVIPRDSTPVNSSQGTGVSHVVATSIIIALSMSCYLDLSQSFHNVTRSPCHLRAYNLACLSEMGVLRAAH